MPCFVKNTSNSSLNVVFRLVLDVPRRLLDARDPNAERAIALLPLEPPLAGPGAHETDGSLSILEGHKKKILLRDFPYVVVFMA